MDQNMTAAVGPPPVEFEFRRLTWEELDAILTHQTFMRTPLGNFEPIELHGGSTVEPYYYDFHGISQPAPKVVYLKVQKAGYSRMDLEVGTEGDNVAQARQNAALKASRRDTLHMLAGVAGRPALSYDEAVQLAADALRDRRELVRHLEEAKAAARASQMSVVDAHECIANVSKRNEDLGIELRDLRELNTVLRQQLDSAQTRPDNKAPTPRSEYDAKHMTPAQFMELAQVFFARRSVWTADEAWVKERLVYLASTPLGKFLPEVVAIRMCEMALNPTSPSPAQRAKMEGDGKAEFLDVWLRELGEDRQWLGSAGGPAFGPARDQKPEPRGPGCEFSAAQLALPEVFVRMAAGARRQRVCVVQHFHRDREVPGFFDDTQFIPLSLCIVEDIIPHGFREVDIAELSVGQQVLVRDGDDSELMWVEVASRACATSDGTLKVDLGYYQTTESSWTEFTPFTRETYVKTRGGK